MLLLLRGSLTLQTEQAIEALFHGSACGSQEAVRELVPLLYAQLRKLAAKYIVREGPGRMLGPTALVHELYLKLARSKLTLSGQVQFYCVASRVMRNILVDEARKRKQSKHGGGAELLPLDEKQAGSSDLSRDVSTHLEDLQRALERLERLDPRKSQIVDLIFFGGLTYDEAAAVLDLSPATVDRELRVAKAWLHREICVDPSGCHAV